MYSDSWFKYNNHLIENPNAQYPNTGMDNSCESSVSDSPDYYLWDTWDQKKGRDKGFFRKPRISICELKPDHKDISISGGSPKTEIFEGLLWGLPIYNKDWKIFSTNASRCRIEINIMKNNTTIYDRVTHNK